MASVTSSRDKVLSAFSAEGYLERTDLIENFVNACQWRPDLLLSKDDHERLAVLIRDDLTIPEYMASALARNPVPTEFGLGIVCTSPRFVGFETVQGAVENRIALYELSKSGKIVPLVTQETVDNLPLVDLGEKTAILSRYGLHKHIPSAIIRNLNSAGNLCYSNQLSRFASDYESKSMSDDEDEDRFVMSFIKSLFNQIFPDRELVKSIEALKSLEYLMRQEGIRDHFLHSFQVFLLGSIILDRYHDQFSTWHSKCFPRSKRDEIDRAWLLTSLLHDTRYPFENISKWSGLDAEMVHGIRIETPQRRAELLGSLFEYSCKGTAGSNWNTSKSRNISNGIIERIAIAHAKRSNHAAISSFVLMGKESLVEPSAFCREICPAALAILLHDKDIWLDMMREGLFPLDAAQFPLVFLLVYCDGLQEWGRPGGKADPRGHDCSLLTLNANVDSFEPCMWFNKKARAVMMQLQHGKALKDVILPRGLNFGCQVRIG